MAAPSRPSYERLLEEAARLDVAEQLLLLERLAATLRERLGDDQRSITELREPERDPEPQAHGVLGDDQRSITELRGLGKEVWGASTLRRT